jgi:hypothetical protein
MAAPLAKSPSTASAAERTAGGDIAGQCPSALSIERRRPFVFVHFLTSQDTVLSPIRSKTDLVNPPLEQGHGKAFAVALRYRFLFMA